MSENPDRLRLCGLSGLFGTTEHTGEVVADKTIIPDRKNFRQKKFRGAGMDNRQDSRI